MRRGPGRSLGCDTLRDRSRGPPSRGRCANGPNKFGGRPCSRDVHVGIERGFGAQALHDGVHLGVIQSEPQTQVDGSTTETGRITTHGSQSVTDVCRDGLGRISRCSHGRGSDHGMGRSRGSSGGRERARTGPQVFVILGGAGGLKGSSAPRLNRSSTEGFGQRWACAFGERGHPSCEGEHAQCGEETGDAALLRVVRHHRQSRLALKDLRCKHGQGTLWSDLDEGPCACSRHGFDLCGPFHRGSHLRSEFFEDRSLGVLSFHGVKGPVDVGGDRNRRPLEVQFLEERAQRSVGWSDDLRMESVGGLQDGARHAFGFKGRHGGFDGCCFSGNDRHLW